MQKLFWILILFAGVANSHPAEDLSEVTGKYVGLCYGLKYLRENYCPKLDMYIPELCVNAAVALYPKKYQSEIRSLMDQQRPKFEHELNAYIDGGFAKSMKMANGDQEKACLGYGTAMVTMDYQLYEEGKKISRSWGSSK